jgi:membrane protease YdiL (CAAX protease family)
MFSKPTRKTLIVAVSGICMIGYSYLNPPADTKARLVSALGFSGVGTETAVYIQRFGCSFVLLGILPFLTARFLGYKLRDLGWRAPVWNRRMWWITAAAAAGVLTGWLSSFSAELAAFYPFDRTLQARVAARGLPPYALHAALYVILYYLPWETLFRGVLIVPFIADNESDGSPIQRMSVAATFQAIPSALLHFGHPVSETVSALLFGIIAAYVVVKSRSLIPVLAFHAAAGLALDAAIVLGGG